MIMGGFIFVLGLIFGSFLNAWEYRLEAKKSLGGRSFCPKCKKTIAWYDNIPLLSWLILQGRCRKCHKPISIQYPAIELITGLTFLGLWLFTRPGIALQQWLNGILNFKFEIFNQFPMIELISFVFCIMYFVLLLLVAIYDAKTKYILSKYVYVAAVLGLAYTALNTTTTYSWNVIYPYLLVILIPAGLFWSLAHFSKERLMGTGDAEIAIAIGALLGWPNVLPAYYFSFITGALYGAYVLLSKRGSLKSEVPLGPFLIAGTLFAFLFGTQIIDWYLGMVFGM